MPPTHNKELNFWQSAALVIGNMIGSGIFLLPATLAVYGGISMLGWLFSSVGAIVLAVLFGNLSRMAPRANGGPYAYTKITLGEFPAYLVAWGYWVSIWSTNAAIAVALIGYLSVFFPVLLSVGISLRLFTTRMAVINNPTTAPTATAVMVSLSVCT